VKQRRDAYLSAWCPKGGAGVHDKAKLRDKERLIVRDETDSFYRGTHIKEVSTLVFPKKRWIRTDACRWARVSPSTLYAISVYEFRFMS